MEYAIHMEYSTIEQEWTENGNSRRMERNRGDEEEDAQGVDADEEKKKKKKTKWPKIHKRKKCRMNITSLKRSLNKFTRQIDLIY